MERFQKVWQQVRWSVAQRGMARTLRVAIEWVRGRRHEGLTTHPFDVEFGVETSGLISGGALAAGGVNDRYSTAYHGIPPSRLRSALERWKATAGTGATGDYVFLDIGCGKGRAMLLASELPFREVVGVELNAGLVRAAEENLKRWRELDRARCSMRCAQGDATEVELPEGRLLVYLYNPFQEIVLRGLLQRLEERGGPVDVLYIVPEHESAFAGFASFKLLWSEPIGISAADATDVVASAAARCNLYRR